MSIAEAWSSGRPVFSRLPGTNGAYTENQVADWLTAYWDELLVETKVKIQEIPTRQLEPITADENWLDFLAPLAGWDSRYWDVSYPLEGKRNLIQNSYSGVSIWENKGTQRVLTFVLSQVGLKNRVVIPGDFLIDISRVGDAIGDRFWEYKIILPTAYRGMDEEKLARRIEYLFGCAWCSCAFEFNDAPFVEITALQDSSGNVVATNLNQGLDVTNG
jgi:Phage tail protein (Tail_P2_I)